MRSPVGIGGGARGSARMVPEFEEPAPGLLG